MNSVDVPKEAGHYTVGGWRYQSRERRELAFLEPNSTDPGADVERALANHCYFVRIEPQEGQDPEREAKRFIEGMRRITEGGTHYEPPEVDGSMSCTLHGDARRGVTCEGRVIYRTAYFREESPTPAEDVRRAIRAGATASQLK